MARKSSTGRGARRGAKPASAAPEVEVLEEVEGGGMGVEGAIVITTFLFLLGAVVMMFMAGQRYAA